MTLSDLADWPFWEHLGRVAPAITALIAGVAALLALLSLKAQLDIARKRAAIDVFLKTEMDQGMNAAYREYVEGLKLSKGYPDIDEFEQEQPGLVSARL